MKYEQAWLQSQTQNLSSEQSEDFIQRLRIRDMFGKYACPRHLPARAGKERGLLIYT
jgi:hypothetical protein